MAKREFSAAVKLEVVKNNLKRNHGEIHCEVCGKKLLSVEESHFDHIVAYAKGGASHRLNCQLLCAECNLKKNDKELQDFVLEERAKRFLAGELVPVAEAEATPVKNETAGEAMSKERFDAMIAAFLRQRGTIHKSDFGREYNPLPPLCYVRTYYGDLDRLLRAFGVENLSLSWTREGIRQALCAFAAEQGDICQKDLGKANRLPSLPCVLHHFPECKCFSDVKRVLCGLETSEHWTEERALTAGSAFAAEHGRITEKDLRAENGLPTSRVIYRLFGSLPGYQAAVGAEISKRNEWISEEELGRAVDAFFHGEERVVVSQTQFFQRFPHSKSTVLKRYGSFAAFCAAQQIRVSKGKKAKYTKREVDDAVSAWVKQGRPIPTAKELSKLGLPSAGVIMRYYADWKEPFYLYERLYEETRRN